MIDELNFTTTTTTFYTFVDENEYIPATITHNTDTNNNNSQHINIKTVENRIYIFDVYNPLVLERYGGTYLYWRYPHLSPVLSYKFKIYHTQPCRSRRYTPLSRFKILFYIEHKFKCKPFNVYITQK